MSLCVMLNSGTVRVEGGRGGRRARRLADLSGRGVAVRFTLESRVTQFYSVISQPRVASCGQWTVEHGHGRREGDTGGGGGGGRSGRTVSDPGFPPPPPPPKKKGGGGALIERSQNNRALDGGSPCRMSNLRNVNVPCYLTGHVPCRSKMFSCHLSNLRNTPCHVP